MQYFDKQLYRPAWEDDSPADLMAVRVSDGRYIRFKLTMKGETVTSEAPRAFNREMYHDHPENVFYGTDDGSSGRIVP